jgi:hypothetical protein
MLNRTTARSLTKLSATISETEFIAPLLVLDGYVCDGHRRLDIAKARGLVTVPCIELPDTFSPETWFLKLNQSTKPFKAEDWFYAWAVSKNRTKTLKDVPSRTRSQIRECIGIFGESRAVEIGATGKQAPGISDYILSFVNACVHLKLDFKKGAIGEWVMKFGLQRWISDSNLAKRAYVEAALRAVQKDKHPGEAK